jgi:nucleotide-binding universal stress UspA family protein
MILICYDGSDDAKSAIELGGRLLAGKPATVLTVWQTFVETLAYSPSGFGLPTGIADDTGQIDEATRQNAERHAREGVEVARQAGFDAEGRTAVMETTAAEAILDAAAELDAEAILMGSRGLGRLKSALVGSVSHTVIHHADRPVIVVPSPDVIAERRKARAEDDD